MSVHLRDEFEDGVRALFLQVAEAARRDGSLDKGLVYLGWDVRTTWGDRISARLRARSHRIPFERALAEIEANRAIHRQEGAVVGVAMCAPAAVLDVARSVESDREVERVARHLAAPPPGGHLKMVILQPHKVTTAHVMIPRPS